jgi:hypothetical protein
LFLISTTLQINEEKGHPRKNHSMNIHDGPTHLFLKANMP